MKESLHAMSGGGRSMRKIEDSISNQPSGRHVAYEQLQLNYPFSVCDHLSLYGTTESKTMCSTNVTACKLLYGFTRVVPPDAPIHIDHTNEN